MNFTRLETWQAEGALLAHSLKVCGRKWNKGRELSRTDIELLQSEGFDTVVVAQIDPDDVDEDTAAESLARVVCGARVRLRPPGTGRCNLYSDCHGILKIEQERLNRINASDEAFTIAALPPYTRVYPDQLLASVKIIPFAVTREQMNRCIGIAG